MKNILWKARVDNKPVVVACVGLDDLLLQTGNEWQHEYEMCMVRSIWENMPAGSLIGRLDGGKIAVIFYGCSKHSVMDRLMMAQETFYATTPARGSFSFGLAYAACEKGDSLQAMQSLVNRAEARMEQNMEQSEAQ